MGLSIKGLLFENLDGMYKEGIDQLFELAKLSREEFDRMYEFKAERLKEGFDKTILNETRKFFTREINFYYKGILAVQKYIGKRYAKSFKLYFSYLSACHFVVENGLKEIGAKTMSTTTTEAIAFGLFARLLRVADQVGILLLNGYADAALVVWRTFYEQAIVLMFLTEQNDEALSLRFRDHSILYSKRLLESYSKRLVTEGLMPWRRKPFKVLLTIMHGWRMNMTRCSWIKTTDG